MALRKFRVCCACSCCCCLFLPLLVAALVSLVALGRQPKFCSADEVQSNAAAVEARPDVYNSNGDISWATVASGWNTACGDIPQNFTAASEQYAEETGGLPIIQDDSGFKSNAWTSSTFKVWKVMALQEAEGYPFGERAQTIDTVVKTFSVNLFFLPTATSEIVGLNALQYEVCAYFADPGGAVPKFRLYKTTESPLGATDPFVQAFKKHGADEIEYWAMSPRYNDDGDTVGVAHFVSQKTDACLVWSDADGNYGIFVLIVLLIISLVVLCCVLGVGIKKNAFVVTKVDETP